MRSGDVSKPCRIFAVEIRSRKVGYAIVEGDNNLLDWGVRTFLNPEDSSSHRRLAVLFALFRPSMILLSDISKRDRRREHAARALIHLVAIEAESLSISIELVSKDSIRSFFNGAGHLTKHEMARVIVTIFPELAWHLPRQRKAWQSESPSQIVFDALALLIFYVAKNQGRNPDEQALWSAPGDE
jgi:hypothetical protein